ncbi:hypothetical protein NPIL_667521 [Nephila pilipes]|uniref:Uncharacterized protein n=1 Tax=Nephila pilipes TaxID=299642 RepID=A0A8X6TGZ0_NEPPI|nr:hypothetical protein NPIL_667521 [Nephila pilipes]
MGRTLREAPQKNLLYLFSLCPSEKDQRVFASDSSFRFAILRPDSKLNWSPRRRPPHFSLRGCRYTGEGRPGWFSPVDWQNTYAQPQWRLHLSALDDRRRYGPQTERRGVRAATVSFLVWKKRTGDSQVSCVPPELSSDPEECLRTQLESSDKWCGQGASRCQRKAAFGV